jgi:hypothetical protein
MARSVEDELAPGETAAPGFSKGDYTVIEVLATTAVTCAEVTKPLMQLTETQVA